MNILLRESMIENKYEKKLDNGFQAGVNKIAKIKIKNPTKRLMSQEKYG